MNYLEKATDLQNQIGQGKTMDAFEQYYAEDVKVIEIPTGEIREGKAAQRKAIQDWHSMVQEVHASGVKSITSNEEEGVTTCEAWMDITTKDGQRWQMEEVAIQKWRGDQILEERFYYQLPKDAMIPSEEQE